MGPISPDKLGITLTHEHIIVDTVEMSRRRARARMFEFGAMERYFLNKPVNMELLGMLRHGDILNKDNRRLNDMDVAIEELKEFKRYGGKSIVSATTPDIGREPITLRKISVDTGLNIILSTGWYSHYSHPNYIKEMSVKELSEKMVIELIEGIGDTCIKAGLIKCAAYDPVPYHPDEKKVMQAAVRAQKETGVGFTIHPSLGACAAEIYLDLIEKEGADINKFYLSHSDKSCYDLDYHRKLLERGIILNYDRFGQDFYMTQRRFGSRNPNDAERVNAVVELCKQGYDKQIMLAHDTYIKIQLKKYGGYGYSHILEHIVPELLYNGVTRNQINNMLIENPKRILQQQNK